ncbi:acetyl-CoA carboxylase biotin carboxyl carrier protein [Hathewaya limosa]|uniref:Biotin carboxyl carrier protein of acetyl-CoA carboxylase n=2 Tax=Hathewaya limosa TaxID=1536 RepID=A0ABU0JXV2_HATLI|nr:acetyl-CoA carboxylase biotin carboxyl carrier protein [Clostridiaceae bacterium 14S0207]MDQ0480747.1 acetyl-CoA carboxylase biotin carboxyl carrier protein [Hathewaya limosa]
MDYKEIENLIKVLDKSKFNYIEIKNHGFAITLGNEVPKYNSNNNTEESKINIEEKVTEQVKDEEKNCLSNKTKIKEDTQEKKCEISQEQVIKEECKQDEDTDLEDVVSPIVGTFYSSPSPDEKVFVNVGQKVKKGETLCIIEAMKLMNEINAQFDCEIVEVLVQNEEMVEFNQSLFKVKKM